MSDEEPEIKDNPDGDNPEEEPQGEPQDDPQDELQDDYQVDEFDNDEDLKQSNLQKLPITIDEQGLDENQKLRKWKELQNLHNQEVQKLKRKNNNLRGQLKKLGEKADKLVQSNVRKQKLMEQKLDPKHSHLAEKKILYEIKYNGKAKTEFTNKIDVRILDLLIGIDSQEQQNNTVRDQIRALKDRNKNLDQTQEVNRLRNELSLVGKQIQNEEKLNKKFEIIVKEQEAILRQQQVDCDYESRLTTLRENIKTLRENIKQLQKQELDYTRKEFEMNNVFAQLQKIYRTICKQQNLQCEEKFLQRPKQDLQDTKKDQMKELSQKIFEDNQKKILDQKSRVKPEEPKDQLNEALQQFREKREETFKQIQEEVKTITEKLEENNKDVQTYMKSKIDEQSSLSEDIAQLTKLLKEREIQTKSSTTKLNDLQRQIQLIERKPKSEPVLSTALKPEKIIFGIDKKTETCLTFDDSKNLDWADGFKIQQIIIHTNKENRLIIGLEVKYTNWDEKAKEDKISKQISEQPEDTIIKEQFDIDQDDQISKITGYYNSEQIIFLKFETTKKKFKQVGNMKYKDAFTKDFRLDIKDKLILGFNGIFDFTQDSQTPSERYLVAFGVELKLKEDDIQTKKRQRKRAQQEEEEKKRVPVDARKINYAFKKNQPKHLEMVKSQPQLDITQEDQIKMQYFQKEKQRYIQVQRHQLGLDSAKQFKPSSYKSPEYLEEEQKRKEQQEKRKNWVDQKREENKSLLTLPNIQQKTPVDKDKKTVNNPKTASPNKKQPQKEAPKQEAPKKNDPKAKNK